MTMMTTTMARSKPIDVYTNATSPNLYSFIHAFIHSIFTHAHAFIHIHAFSLSHGFHVDDGGWYQVAEGVRLTRPVLPLLSSHRSTSNQPSALGHRSPVSSPRDSPNLWTDRFHGLVLEAWRLGQCPWVQQQRKIPCLRLYSRDARRRPSSCGCRSGSRCSNGTRRLLGTTSSAWVIQVFDGEVALRGVEAMAAGLAVLALANRGWVSIGQGGEVAAELLEQECGSVEAVGAGEVVAAVEQ
jgi:hypothetical protein